MTNHLFVTYKYALIIRRNKSYIMKTLAFITLLSATDLVFGVPPINFAIKYGKYAAK